MVEPLAPGRVRRRRRHGPARRAPDRHGVTQTRRALVWGLALPAAALVGSLVTPWALVLLAAYPAQVVRLALRKGGRRGDWEEATFLTLGKFPEAMGSRHATHRGAARRARVDRIQITFPGSPPQSHRGRKCDRERTPDM